MIKIFDKKINFVKKIIKKQKNLKKKGEKGDFSRRSRYYGNGSTNIFILCRITRARLINVSSCIEPAKLIPSELMSKNRTDIKKSPAYRGNLNTIQILLEFSGICVNFCG